MKTFKQFNEEARQHLDEIDRNMGGLGLGVKIMGGAANIAKKVTIGGVRRAIGAARGIKKFIKNRPNTSKFEIQQDAREEN